MVLYCKLDNIQSIQFFNTNYIESHIFTSFHISSHILCTSELRPLVAHQCPIRSPRVSHHAAQIQQRELRYGCGTSGERMRQTQSTWGTLAEQMAHMLQALPLYVASISYRFMTQALTRQDHLSTLIFCKH